MSEQTIKYKHCDVFDDKLMSFHDCCADKICLKDDVITLYFDDGFWITPEHKYNDLNYTVRTDSSKAEIYLNQDKHFQTVVYTFRKNLFGKVIRKELEFSELMDIVNSGKFKLEFIHRYDCYHNSMFECYLTSDKRPYSIECMIYIPLNKVNVYWNNLREDARW